MSTNRTTRDSLTSIYKAIYALIRKSDKESELKVNYQLKINLIINPKWREKIIS